MSTEVPQPPASDGAVTRRARVLVVDDEPQLLRALRINLAARRYEVTTAGDGAAALQEATAQPPDLVVLDLGLPDMDGVDVIRALRQGTPVPIIVLSGRAGSSDKIHALDAGADDYVTKPFSLDELLARIRAVTRRTGPPDVATVTIGRHRINLADRTLRSTDGEPPHLTRTEWQPTPANSSPNAACYNRSGAPATKPRPTTCANTWPTCAANSRTTPPTPGTCSPNPAWATASPLDPP